MSSANASQVDSGSIRQRAEALCELVREEAAASERFGRLTVDFRRDLTRGFH